MLLLVSTSIGQIPIGPIQSFSSFNWLSIYTIYRIWKCEDQLFGDHQIDPPACHQKNQASILNSSSFQRQHSNIKKILIFDFIDEGSTPFRSKNRFELT